MTKISLNLCLMKHWEQKRMKQMLSFLCILHAETSRVMENTGRNSHELLEKLNKPNHQKNPANIQVCKDSGRSSR